MNQENNNIYNNDDPKICLTQIFMYLKDTVSSPKVKLSKNYITLSRKLYKLLKENSNFLHITFQDKNSHSSSSPPLLLFDQSWENVKVTLKEWICLLFEYINGSFCNNSTATNSDSILITNYQLYIYFIVNFFFIKEICKVPPLQILTMKTIQTLNNNCNRFYFYLICEFIIYSKHISFLLDNYDYIITLATYETNDLISNKFVLILKDIYTKHYNELLNYDNDIDKSNIKLNKFIDTCTSSMKVNLDIHERSNQVSNSYFSFFKNMFTFTSHTNLQPKELDGTNITDILTVLNICDFYSQQFANNVLIFSSSYEIMQFIQEHNLQFSPKIKELKSLLYSYCIRIFDQSETFLESRKSKNSQVLIHNLQYNNNLIEACVLENLKIVNALCKVDSSLSNIFYMRIKQVYERIAMKQSGICLIEILQFFFDNHSSLIVDLEFYLSDFFTKKLCFNYKNEILAYYTLNFLYNNKHTINSQTNIFVKYYPLLIKLFTFFPKYINTKFFELMDYMTQPETITEMFNFFLDLPTIVLIISNFEQFDSLNQKHYNEMFSEEYVKLIEILLRDEAFDKDIDNNNKNEYFSIYDKQIKFLFDNLVYTSRVHSTTKIVPLLLHKFFIVLIERNDIIYPIEIINLIFERFSNFHGSESFKKEIRNVLVQKTELLFRQWPMLVTELQEEIMNEIQSNFNNEIKRELICFLLWSISEFLSIQNNSNSSYTDQGIKSTIDSLQVILLQAINDLKTKSNEEPNISKLNTELNSDNDNLTVADLVEKYSVYYLDKTSQSEILTERNMTVLIDTLGKLAFKFKAFTGRTLHCFVEIKNDLLQFSLRNNSINTILAKINEMIVRFEHIAIQTEYLIY